MPPQPRSRVQNYLAGLTTGYARMAFQVLVGLWLTPFTLGYLDREQYAIFSLTLDVVTWLAILDLGIAAGLRVQAARLSGQPDTDQLNRLASTAFFAQSVVVFVVFAVAVGIALGFPVFFTVRADLQLDATCVLLIMGFAGALSVGTQTFSALLIAHQQMHVDNLISVLLIVIRTVLTVVLLKWGWGLYSLAAAHLAAKLVTSVLAVSRTYRLIPNLQIRFRLASWEIFRGTANLGIWFTLGSLASIAINSLDNTVAAKVVSVASVTALALTGKFYELVGALVWSITETARPMLGQMLGQQKLEEARRAYRNIFALSTGLAVVAALMVWSGNSSFITSWVGAVNYAGVNVDLVFAACVVMHMWVMPNRAILSANLALRSQCLVRIAEGLLNVGLSILLGRHYGLTGIMLGTLLAGMLTSMWILPLLTARMFQRPFLQFLWEDASRIFVLIALLFPVAWYARSLSEQLTGYLGAAAGAALTGVCGLLLVWFLVLDQSLRARVPFQQLLQNRLLAPLRAFSR